MARHERRDDLDDPSTGDTAADTALAWFVRLRAGNVRTAERLAFRAWHDADPAHRAAYRKVEALWAEPAVTEAARRARDGAGAEGPVNGPGLGRRLAAAAAALLLIAAAGAYLAWPGHPAADHATATGEQREIVLADGSRLLLDTASAIAVEFDGTRRRVRLLEGRAHFQVAAADRPFAVVAGPAEVSVTGTAFAVALDDDGASVALQEGKLSVRADGGDAPVTLRPGQRVRVGKSGPEHPQPVPFRTAASWVTGRLVFRNRPLGEVLAELDRYHSGWIVVADPDLAALRVTGNYRLDDPVRTVAQLADVASANLLRVSERLLILH